MLELALAQELNELQYFLSLQAFIFRKRAAKLDDEFLSWFEETLGWYKGEEPVKPYIELCRALIKVDISLRGQPDKKRGLSLKEGEAPLLNIHTNEIALFPVPSQVLLLRVAKKLSIFNQHVSYLRSQFDKTFDNLSETSHAAVRQNLEDGYDHLTQRAMAIADLIKSAPPSLHRNS